MRLTIATNVEQPYKQVLAGFTEELFLQLAPPFPRVHLQRFDGCKAGGTVLLELDFLLFKQQWRSHIIADGEVSADAVYKDEVYFVDTSAKEDLPFFLTAWQHTHRIVSRAEAGSTIVDAIEFKALWGLDLLVLPALWLQFIYRKPVYKRVFRRLSA
jgi:ligand-binding SRPBCC domain-containing protein